MFETKWLVPHVCALPSISELIPGLWIRPFRCPRYGRRWQLEFFAEDAGTRLSFPLWAEVPDGGRTAVGAQDLSQSPEDHRMSAALGRRV